MGHQFEHGFEQHWRLTYPTTLTPDQLFDASVIASFAAKSLAYHYDGKQVTATAPVWDDGQSSEHGIPALKMLCAGNFKPVLETAEDNAYTRVCAEQNLIDNALKLGDTLCGVLFIRGPENMDRVEGTKQSEALKMCKPCRGRSLTYLGGNLVIVSLRGDDLRPIEATTLYQQIQEQDFDYEHEALAYGDDVKEFVVEEVLKTNNFIRKIDRLPRLPSRRYRRRTDQ